jgi:Trk K+ transport system NAD-binding subunit
MGQNITDANIFLVCGLGNLGQYCVSVLKEFGVKVNAIELNHIKKWQVPDLPDLVDNLVIGDCRQPKILEQAGIRECRAILIVTSDEGVNIAAAFAARSLNSKVRLVIRSTQENLNELLRENLGNFAAFEATRLPAKSFALFAYGSETRGFFNLENQLMRVVKVKIDPSHYWCDRRKICEINNTNRRVITHVRTRKPLPKGFYHWEPDAQIQEGDTITYIEATEKPVLHRPRTKSSPWLFLRAIATAMRWKNLRSQVSQFWEQSSQTQRVAAVSGMVMVSLFLCGTLLYKLQYSKFTWQDALNVSLVLSIGGFDNLFGQFQVSSSFPFPIPWWLHLFSISITVAGTVFIGILYAMMTERVLAARFQFPKRRLPVPKADHVVLIGLGRLGQQVAKLLQELKQPLVAIHPTELEPGVLPGIPLIQGNIKNALSKVNIATAKSVIVVTDDEVANLEIGLLAHAANPTANLAIRTFDPRFSENIGRLLPYARVLGAYMLSAEAFAAAAFGENIHQTTLVAEYEVVVGNSLHGKLLAEVAYGYGVVPILYFMATEKTLKFMPSDDTKLDEGDRLVVLATIEGLQRVERSIVAEPQWLVQVEKALSEEAVFEGAAVISRVTGCEMLIARTIMKQLPTTLFPLYKHQAYRLVSQLSKSQVVARITE